MDTTPPTKKLKTLEEVTQQLIKQGTTQPDELDMTIHAASLLAMISASYAVINEYVVPTPLFRMEYDHSSNSLKFRELNGRAPVPKKDSIDVNMLDFTLSALLREKISLLYEGITGIGKTLTTEMLMKTILPPENYRVIRLSAAMTNVQQPYIEGVVENGVLKVNIRKEALEKIAVIFIDEQNRGDTNQMLQLKDGKISLASGESGYLGLPIPRMKSSAAGVSWQLDHENKRPLFVTAAQNPSGTKAAQYTQTRGTDAALKGRDLEVKVPNAAGAIGASIMRVKRGNGQHEDFIERFTENLANYLGISKDAISKDIGKEMTIWYALATDPKRSYRQEIRSATELTDVMALMFSNSLETEFLHDQETANEWNDRLRPRGGWDFSYNVPLTQTASIMEKIRNVVGTFQEQLVPRDIAKAKELADALSLTRIIKQALKTPNHVPAYINMPSYITVQDVAVSYTIMVKDKQQSTKEDPLTVVNQVLHDYITIVQDFAKSIGYKKGQDSELLFDANDPMYSVYGLAVSHAISSTKKGGVIAGIRNAITGSTSLTDKFIEDLSKSAAILRRVHGDSESKKPIIARMISDISTLAGFVDQYSTDIESMLSKKEDDKSRLIALREFYTTKKAQPDIEDIYLQRLPKVLGV